MMAEGGCQPELLCVRDLITLILLGFCVFVTVKDQKQDLKILKVNEITESLHRQVNQLKERCHKGLELNEFHDTITASKVVRSVLNLEAEGKLGAIINSTKQFLY